jgi:hypothetical protein
MTLLASEGTSGCYGLDVGRRYPWRSFSAASPAP